MASGILQKPGEGRLIAETVRLHTFALENGVRRHGREDGDRPRVDPEAHDTTIEAVPIGGEEQMNIVVPLVASGGKEDF